MFLQHYLRRIFHDPVQFRVGQRKGKRVADHFPIIILPICYCCAAY